MFPSNSLHVILFWKHTSSLTNAKKWPILGHRNSEPFHFTRCLCPGTCAVVLSLDSNFKMVSVPPCRSTDRSVSDSDSNWWKQRYDPCASFGLRNLDATPCLVTCTCEMIGVVLWRIHMFYRAEGETDRDLFLTLRSQRSLPPHVDAIDWSINHQHFSYFL